MTVQVTDEQRAEWRAKYLRIGFDAPSFDDSIDEFWTAGLVAGQEAIKRVERERDGIFAELQAITAERDAAFDLCQDRVSEAQDAAAEVQAALDRVHALARVIGMCGNRIDPVRTAFTIECAIAGRSPDSESEVQAWLRRVRGDEVPSTLVGQLLAEHHAAMRSEQSHDQLGR